MKKIGDHAFDNCDNIVSVNIFGNVAYIGDYAFYDCDSLEEATPSFGLEYLGGLAFAYCEKLEVAYIPATVSQLGGNPYVGCSKATLEIDQDNPSFQTIDGALYDNYGATLYYYPATILTETVEFPLTVTTIAAGAFAGAQMKHVIYPARFGTIPASMFSGCDKLETIQIADGITEIGDHAFDGCVSLTTVRIPNSVTYVGNYAFANCTSLASYEIVDKTGSDYYLLGTNIFDGCISLTTGVLPNAWMITAEDADASGIKSWDSRGKNQTEPATEAQKKANIPSYMFANSGITSITVPATCDQLRTRGVFMNCENLTTVSFLAAKINQAASYIGADYFTGVPFDYSTLPFGTGDGSVKPGGGLKI